MKLTIDQIKTELSKVDSSVVMYKFDEKYYCYLNGDLYRLFTFGPYGYQVIRVV